MDEGVRPGYSTNSCGLRHSTLQRYKDTKIDEMFYFTVIRWKVEAEV